MDLRDQWPVLDDLCRCAGSLPGLTVWAFGSMLRTRAPRDLDVLVVYDDRADVIALRAMKLWEVNVPVVDLIAMTPDEEKHYEFIKTMGAVRIHPV